MWPTRAFPWSFGGPPTLSELVVATMGIVMVVGGLSFAATVGWGWFVVGGVLGVVALGPVKAQLAASAASASFGTWSKEADAAWRLLVIIALTVAFFGAVELVGVPWSSVHSLSMGGLLAVSGVVAVKLIRHREIAD